MTDKDIQRRIKEFYAEALEEKICKDTLETIRECKSQIEHLIEFGMIKETETFTDLLENIKWSIQYLKDSDLCNFEGIPYKY